MELMEILNGAIYLQSSVAQGKELAFSFQKHILRVHVWNAFFKRLHYLLSCMLYNLVGDIYFFFNMQLSVPGNTYLLLKFWQGTWRQLFLKTAGELDFGEPGCELS